MTENPIFDPVRSAAIRDELRTMVSPAAARRPARRAILFASIATAVVLAIGGTGVAIARLNSAPAPGHGVIVQPTTEPSSPYSDIPLPTSTPTDGSGDVEGAGTPSPTPIAPDPDLANPSSWVISFTGVGPLKLGQERAAAESDMTAFTSTSSASTCPARFYSRVGFPGVIFSTDAPATTLSVITVGDGIDYTPTQFANSPKTEAGIHLGSTVGEVKAAYPAIVADQGVPSYGNLVLADGQGHWLVFFVTDGVVRSISAQTTSQPYSEYCG